MAGPLPHRACGRVLLVRGRAAERRGARRWHSTRSSGRSGRADGFDLARRVFGSGVEPVEVEVVDLSLDHHGSFDLTLSSESSTTYAIRSLLWSGGRDPHAHARTRSHVDLRLSEAARRSFLTRWRADERTQRIGGASILAAIEAMLHVVGSRGQNDIVFTARAAIEGCDRPAAKERRPGFFAAARQGGAVFTRSRTLSPLLMWKEPARSSRLLRRRCLPCEQRRALASRPRAGACAVSSVRQRSREGGDCGRAERVEVAARRLRRPRAAARMSEQATGVPRIIASSTGRPKPSASDGSTKHVAAR